MSKIEMKNLCTAGWFAFLTSTIVLRFAPATLTAQATDPIGTWRGQSTCVQQGTACNNETVVYYIDAVPGHPDMVQIRADKIVDGKAVTMGSGPWHFDANVHTLEWKTPRQTWLLSISGTRIEGTLTLSDGTLVRRMTLQKQ